MASATTEKPRTDMPADVERIIAERVAAEVARLDAERAAKLDALIAEKMAAFNPTATAAMPDQSVLSALAEAIYSVNGDNQDAARRRVPPEIMAKRARAREAMETVIKETIDSGTQPIYTLRQKCYLGDRMIPPFWYDPATRSTKPTEIGWWGVPNEFMHPVNAEAQAISELYLESIDSHRKTDRNLRVTVGGLTVRSGGMNPEGGRDSAPRVGRDIHEPSLAGRNGDRPVIETRILGTIMPPARQMV